MKVTARSIGVFWDETKVIQPTITEMIKGLAREMNNVLSNSDIIAKDELYKMTGKFNAIRENLSPYADDAMSVVRSIAKPRKDGSTLDVDAAILDDLKAFRADLLDALENIHHLDDSFRKRANLHNMALGDYENILEPAPVIPKKKASEKKGNDPKVVAAADTPAATE